MINKLIENVESGFYIDHPQGSELLRIDLTAMMVEFCEEGKKDEKYIVGLDLASAVTQFSTSGENKGHVILPRSPTPEEEDKFKKGDLVKIVNVAKCLRNEYEIGDICEIHSYTGDDIYKVYTTNKSNYWFFDEDKLEVYSKKRNKNENSSSEFI